MSYDVSSSSCEDLHEASTRAEIQRLLLMDDRIQSLTPDSNSHFNTSLQQFPLFNFSLDEALRILLSERQREDRDLGGHAEVALIIVYAVLMVAGLVTNLLVSFVVARRTQMHTARNLYIVNLTISDITLCVICMPSTLVAILRRQWTLGSALCKLVPALQGTNIMVSVGTITVIALDRYLTIVRHSGRDGTPRTRRRVVLSIALIWLLAAAVTAPVCYFQVVEAVTFQRVVLYEACIERWPSRRARLFYAVCLLLLQSVIPALVVATVHARIASYLHAHATTQRDSRRARKELERNRRTTLLLTGVAVLFAVSWLPLGLFSVLVDLLVTPTAPTSPRGLYVALATCHVVAMTSAVSNPIVYGWLNSNIRREFLQLLPARCACAANRHSSNERAKATTIGVATEDVTTRTQLNHFSVAPLNNGPVGMQQTTAAESMALLTTASNKDSQNLQETGEVSVL
ncbi:neuropeptide F receptor [Cryptotermes secundus]|uniref:neuropeptide F receptor n=1 Tax=Cryptotermes secundus TaxID=105785 RepID=UPI001454C19F|nr:neuropeptide F receptor [Cryptotermes secundus]